MAVGAEAFLKSTSKPQTLDLNPLNPADPRDPNHAFKLRLLPNCQTHECIQGPSGLEPSNVYSHMARYVAFYHFLPLPVFLLGSAASWTRTVCVKRTALLLIMVELAINSDRTRNTSATSSSVGDILQLGGASGATVSFSQDVWMKHRTLWPFVTRYEPLLAEHISKLHAVETFRLFDISVPALCFFVTPDRAWAYGVQTFQHLLWHDLCLQAATTGSLTKMSTSTCT